MQLIKALILAISFRGLSTFAFAFYANDDRDSFDLSTRSDELDARDMDDLAPRRLAEHGVDKIGKMPNTNLFTPPPRGWRSGLMPISMRRDLDHLLEPRRLAPTPPTRGPKPLLTQNRRDLDDMEEYLFEPRTPKDFLRVKPDPKTLRQFLARF